MTPVNIDQVLLPDLRNIRESDMYQNQIEERLQELRRLNETGSTGILKSQRGGALDVVVKHRIPWPQNHILSGSNKSRFHMIRLVCVNGWLALVGLSRRNLIVKLKT